MIPDRHFNEVFVFCDFSRNSLKEYNSSKDKKSHSDQVDKICTSLLRSCLESNSLNHINFYTISSMGGQGSFFTAKGLRPGSGEISKSITVDIESCIDSFKIVLANEKEQIHIDSVKESCIVWSVIRNKGNILKEVNLGDVTFRKIVIVSDGLEQCGAVKLENPILAQSAIEDFNLAYPDSALPNFYENKIPIYFWLYGNITNQNLVERFWNHFLVRVHFPKDSLSKYSSFATSAPDNLFK